MKKRSVKVVVDRKKLFNPLGDDSLIQRKIIKGDTTNLFNLNNVKYQWGNQLYRTMMGNFWIPEKIDLTQDKNDYSNLTEAEKEAYDGILSFLIFLDSIQTNNIPNISDYITAPEVNLVLSIQTFQEAIHSQSYQYIIESILPKETRTSIYDKWREDKVLFAPNIPIKSKSEPKSTIGEDIKNENVTPKGNPALVKPINKGIEEQEQKGVTVPSNAPIIFALIP